MSPISLGSCDNHADAMESGGLVPKGPKCFNKATVVMVYVETVNPWDGKPNTVETAKLCDGCLKYAKGYVQFKRRERSKQRGSAEGSAWVRRLKVFPPEKVTAEHVSALCRSYKRVPRALRDLHGLDEDGRPKSTESERREALNRRFWGILCGEPMPLRSP